MPETTHVNIVSAERSIFSGEAEMVVVPGELGELGIIPGHAPLLTILQPGDIRLIRSGGVEEVYYVSGGMLEVLPYIVTVLADQVIRAEELSEEAAFVAKAKAEALLSQQTEIDYSVVAAELARAIAQIRAIQKLKKQH